MSFYTFLGRILRICKNLLELNAVAPDNAPDINHPCVFYTDRSILSKMYCYPCLSDILSRSTFNHKNKIICKTAYITRFAKRNKRSYYLEAFFIHTSMIINFLLRCPNNLSRCPKEILVAKSACKG